MTVSIWIVRLSSVITGCGGNETTCSRMSSSGRTRSTYGITSASPGSQRALVAAQALDDAGARLGDDAHAAGDGEQHHDCDDDQRR